MNERQEIARLRERRWARMADGKSGQPQLDALSVIWKKTPEAFLRPPDQWELPLEEHNRQAFAHAVKVWLDKSLEVPNT